MEPSGTTIYELVRARFHDLTRAERQLANSLLENYPVSGLASITTVARNANVSSPTVARMVQKLGFDRYAGFQAALRRELEAKISSPLVKHNQRNEGAAVSHGLTRFAESVMQNLQQTLNHIDVAEFDEICTRLADPKHRIYIVGGRITRVLAEYLFAHLQMIRPDVTLLPSAANRWPSHVLDMREKDMLVVFDIRRYENQTLQLAGLAKERKLDLVLLTDQWGSPISRHADYSINCRIEAPSAWDSSADMLVVIEAMIAQIQGTDWKDIGARMDQLEQMFDAGHMFRKFR